MRVMVIIRANASTEAGVMPTEELMTAMGSYHEELAAAGLLLGGEGLHPSSKGVRVEFSGSGRTVVDGPFAETKELIAGYWIWRVASMAEAVAWAKRAPYPTGDESVIELRPIFELDDFGAELTPELREQETRLWAAAAERRDA